MHINTVKIKLTIEISNVEAKTIIVISSTGEAELLCTDSNLHAQAR